ncbi:hypothetical protein [Clostridium sp. ZS2-4]|uniref:hypothetical protein n=1 Tax=Clostridium sp. ZS2-4 TaxID=2987703 RepID=UPI00227C6EBB|nr:hypothetical protein [Clostridium sp. ZS2-4]MCY6355812.1 hypothetical protein [Clostridium sp. ZS2-4]
MKFINKLSVLHITLILTLFFSLTFSHSKQKYIDTLSQQALKVEQKCYKESQKASLLEQELISLQKKLNNLQKESIELKEKNNKLKKQLHT